MLLLSAHSAPSCCLPLRILRRRPLRPRHLVTLSMRHLQVRLLRHGCKICSGLPFSLPSQRRTAARQYTRGAAGAAMRQLREVQAWRPADAEVACVRTQQARAWLATHLASIHTCLCLQTDKSTSQQAAAVAAHARLAYVDVNESAIRSRSQRLASARLAALRGQQAAEGATGGQEVWRHAKLLPAPTGSSASRYDVRSTYGCRRRRRSGTLAAA